MREPNDGRDAIELGAGSRRARSRADSRQGRDTPETYPFFFSCFAFSERADELFVQTILKKVSIYFQKQLDFHPNPYYIFQRFPGGFKSRRPPESDSFLPPQINLERKDRHEHPFAARTVVYLYGKTHASQSQRNAPHP